MKRLFNTRLGQIFGVALGFGFGIYNLYILGRCDQIQETMDHAFSDPTTSEPLTRTYKLYGGKEKTVEIYPLWDLSDHD